MQYSAESAENATLLKTRFFAQYVAPGAKMVPFAGFEMPVHYLQRTRVARVD